jgi:septal ring factor EnvC (AmiA/AmiB activator)
MTYHLRGKVVCANHEVMPMGATDHAVLTVIERDVLDPRVVERTIQKTLVLLQPTRTDRQDRRDQLHATLERIESELARLLEVIVAGAGDASTLAKAIRERERQKTRLEAELAALERHGKEEGIDGGLVERKMRARLGDWQALSQRHVADARQVLRDILNDRLVFTPKQINDETL